MKQMLRRSTAYHLDDAEMFIRNAEKAASPEWEARWYGMADTWIGMAADGRRQVEEALRTFGPNVVLIGGG